MMPHNPVMAIMYLFNKVDEGASGALGFMVKVSLSPSYSVLSPVACFSNARLTSSLTRDSVLSSSQFFNVKTLLSEANCTLGLFATDCVDSGDLVSASKSLSERFKTGLTSGVATRARDIMPN
jgi:hypothetical protein